MAERYLAACEESVAIATKAASNPREFPRLAGGGPTMRLPRRGAPPRNVVRDMMGYARWGDANPGMSRWDLLDYLAVAGGLVSLVGLLLALWPSTRSAGILVPAGLAVMALSAYGARRKDEARF